jgi:tetratricopeptide (TPR) repeat protein
MPDPESSVAISLRLMKALGLARQGKLDSAQQLLAPADALPESAIEIHALAALVTHGGDYERALRLWRLLLQKDPSHAEARRMISMIELWISRPAWYRYVPGAALTLAILALCALLFWAVQTSEPPAKAPAITPPPRSTPATVAPVPLAPITPVKTAPAKNQRR